MSQKKAEDPFIFKNVGFRNAKFSGYVNHKSNSRQTPSLGIILDDLYLCSISNWTQNNFDGPTVFIYPKQQIFYGVFGPQQKSQKSEEKESSPLDSSKRLDGVWSFIINNNNEESLQIFGEGAFLQEQGKKQEKFLAMCSNSSITKIRVFRDEKEKERKLSYEIMEQIDFQEKQEKFEKIEEILNYKFQEEEKSLSAFLHFHFQKRDSKDAILSKIPVSNYPENTFLYKFENFEGESLGAIIEYQQTEENFCTRIHEIGYFKVLPYGSDKLEFGRKYKYKGKILPNNGATHNAKISISQGNFSNGQVYDYYYTDISSRPSGCMKLSQKYFRQTTQFKNKYIHLPDADNLYGLLTNITKIYVEQCNQRHGQVVLEKGYQSPVSLKNNDKPQKTEEQIFKNNFMSRKSRYGKQEYELHEAKEIILKQIAGKKTSNFISSKNANQIAARSRSRSRSRSREYNHELTQANLYQPTRTSPVRYQPKYSPAPVANSPTKYERRSSPLKKFNYTNVDYYQKESSPKIRTNYRVVNKETRYVRQFDLPETVRYNEEVSPVRYQIESKQNITKLAYPTYPKGVYEPERYEKQQLQPLQTNYYNSGQFSSQRYDKTYRKLHYNYTQDIKYNKSDKRSNISREKSPYRKKPQKRSYKYAD